MSDETEVAEVEAPVIYGVEAATSEYVECETCAVVMPDGASVLAAELGALALRVIYKTGLIEILDSTTFQWRDPKVKSGNVVGIVK